MKNTNEILNVVAGNLKGEARKQVVSELDKTPETKEEFRKIKNAWALLSATKPMPEYQIENLYLNYKKQMEANRKQIRLSTYEALKYAAVFILALGISSLLFYYQQGSSELLNPTLAYASVITENGQVSKVILPDSSVVWLNAATKIMYDNGFAISNRKISLAGQAFFQVKRNEENPFKVFCKEIEVTALGTSFDVSAYPEDENISVIMESGKVEITNPIQKSFRYELISGEMARYETSKENLLLKKFGAGKISLWKEGILVFRDEKMDEVIPKLKRRYNIDIEVVQPAIYNSVFTATIKDETLDEIFKSIGFACSVRYKIIRGDINTRTKVILADK